MVSAGGPCGRTGRAFGRARLHGDPAVGLWSLGEHAAPTRCEVSRERTSKRIFSSVYSTELFREGSGARRRLRQRMRGRHSQPARGGCGWKIETGKPVDRAAGGPANVGNNYRGELREMGAIVS